jgi:hypothetical protein
MASEARRIFTVQNLKKEILHSFTTFGDAYDYIVGITEECFGDIGCSLQENDNVSNKFYYTKEHCTYEYTFNKGLLTWTYYITSHILVPEGVFSKK